MYLINEASRLSGVSERTLRYYDEINLLKAKRRANDYRYYSQEDMEVLQEILFYRYLGSDLKKIKELLTDDHHQRLERLKEQRRLLGQKHQELIQLLLTLDQTIEEAQGGRKLSMEEKFTGFTYKMTKSYEEEAMIRHGKAALQAAKDKQRGKESDLMQQLNQLFQVFSQQLQAGESVDSQKSQALCQDLHQFIKRYAFDCSLGSFEQMGQMYVADQRFKQNIDCFGEGTAAYARATIDYYCRSNQ